MTNVLLVAMSQAETQARNAERRALSLVAPRPSCLYDVTEQTAAATARQVSTQHQFVSHCIDEEEFAICLFSSNLQIMSVVFIVCHSQARNAEHRALPLVAPHPSCSQDVAAQAALATARQHAVQQQHVSFCRACIRFLFFLYK